MPLIAAAVCPHPPLLVPRLAAGAASELDDLRAACAAAIGVLFAARPDGIVVAGAGAVTRDHGPSDFGTLDGYGVPATYALGGRDALAVGERMPLSLTIGAWLIRDRPPAPPRRAIEIVATATAEECAGVGRRLSESGNRIGLLVMGDGSACRGDKSPGYADARAEPFDASVTKAFVAADPGALLAIDTDLAAELLVAGRAPWQVLAGAAASSGSFRGEVLFDSAPYGVQYTVATWSRP